MLRIPRCARDGRALLGAAVLRPSTQLHLPLPRVRQEQQRYQPQQGEQDRHTGRREADRVLCLGGGLVQHVVADHGGVVAEPLGEHPPQGHVPGLDAHAVRRGGIGPEGVVGLVHGGGGEVGVAPQRGGLEGVIGEGGPRRGPVAVVLGVQVLVPVEDHREAPLVQPVQLLTDPGQVLPAVRAWLRLQGCPDHSETHRIQADLHQLVEVLVGPGALEVEGIGGARPALVRLFAVEGVAACREGGRVGARIDVEVSR